MRFDAPIKPAVQVVPDDADRSKRRKAEPFDLKRIVADRIFAQIQHGTPEWRKPWVNGLQKNIGTGTTYNPLNQLLLSSEGYPDHRWLTAAFCIEHEIGFKGAKGSDIVMRFMAKSKEKAKAAASGAKGTDRSEVVSEGKDEKGEKEFLALTLKKVFNCSMLDGVPSLRDSLYLPPFTSNEVIEQLAARMVAETGLKIVHKGLRAYYAIKSDTIFMPNKDYFLSGEDYYGTLLHEMSHSTAHPSRCGRSLDGKYGDPQYAFEEWIAELSAAQTMARFHGTQSETALGQNAAYMGSWGKLLLLDKEAPFKATAMATKASTYLEQFAPASFLEWEARAAAEADEKFAAFIGADPLDKLQEAAAAYDPPNPSPIAMPAEELALAARLPQPAVRAPRPR